MITRSVLFGFTGTAILLTVFFSVVSLISGWPFALSQFSKFWYFIVSLAIGFGIQIGLYTYLKNAIHEKHVSGGMLAVSGTTSTTAMLACCAHYLTNVLPIIGAAGIVTLVGQYQVWLFWVSLAFNIVGIMYIAHKIIIFHRP